jgi:hypothetical protein
MSGFVGTHMALGSREMVGIRRESVGKWSGNVGTLGGARRSCENDRADFYESDAAALARVATRAPPHHLARVYFRAFLRAGWTDRFRKWD